MPVALSLAIDGTAIATNPNEMRTLFAKRPLKSPNGENHVDDNARCLCFLLLRRLEPYSEAETVQYCSFWWVAALPVP